MPSMPIPFVGPSYQLENRRADVQRAVNMYPVRVESGTGKSQFFLRSLHGYDEFASSTAIGKKVVKAMHVADGSSGIFALTEGAFCLVDSGIVSTLGSLTAGDGNVIASGRDHVVITTGAAAYSYNLNTTAFAAISDVDLGTSPTWVCYLAGRYVFGFLNGDQFQWSAIDDPTSIDALDFATAESSPDGLVRGVVYREELWLFGTKTTEVWRASASADSAFERNVGVSISIGCEAPYAVETLDNSLFWIGADRNGGRVVYSAAGYQPRRISNHAIEEKLHSSTDIASATSYSYQWKGHAFYCLNVPGVDTTLVYDVNTDSWHERADFFDGDFSQHRVTCHALSIGGQHIFGGSLVGHPTLSDRSVFYTADDTLSTIDGDTLCRERTSPHFATSSLNTVFYSRFRLDCSVGSAVASPKYVQLSYSNDGGATWSASALQRSLGETGDRRAMIQWNRLGSAKDRVWRIRCTDDVPFDIVSADIQAEQGMA